MAGAARGHQAGTSSSELVYAGFWIRVWASIIDTVLLLIALWPLARMIPSLSRSYESGQLVDQYGQINYAAFDTGPPSPLHILVYWVLPGLVVVIFWWARSATPGKMAIGAKIVDAKTGNKPRTAQLVIRYLGYYVSTIPLCLGLIWVGIDPRKQGWHDKLAGTVVVRPRALATATVQFDHANAPPPADNARQGTNQGWNP